LKCADIQVIREGTRNCWVKIVLTEGRNRHIRRMFETISIEVLRLVRITIRALELGNLSKGEFRNLTREEVKRLRA
jgi:23S rRNA pseudouridine2605 synthase